MVTYSNPGPLAFDAVIQRSDASGSAGFVHFPWSVSELFGVKGRVPVKARFNGIDYRGSLVTYGGPEHMLLVLTEVRRQLGLEAGDTVHVQLELDTEERRIELATDSREALEAAGQLDAFTGMSYSQQREFQRWIEDAKRPETRVRRIETMTGLVTEGKSLK